MSEICPIGTVIPYAGTTLPAGWLFCDGSSVSRTTYSALSSVIGTTYGSVDQFSFNLPDLRGRVPAGRDTMSNTGPGGVGTATGRLSAATTQGVSGQTLGATGGAQSHLILTAEAGVGSHNHVTYANQVSTTVTTNNGQTRLTGLGNVGNNETGFTSTNGANASTAHNNVQPTIILNYIIKY